MNHPETQMKIKFSRHAKRRAKLYQLSEATIENILVDLDLKNGEHEIIQFVEGNRYPIKIVAYVKENTIIVVTNYPLKKGAPNESTL